MPSPLPPIVTTRRRRLLAAFVVVVAAAGAHDGIVRAEVDAAPRVTAQRLVMADEDLLLARAAWRYFEHNRLASGLVSSAANFPATTMWDVGSQLAGMVSGFELGFLSRTDFDVWMRQVLAALSTLPLCKAELPNKSYNALTLQPTTYGDVANRKEIGFSALDLGRLALWLSIVATRYPEHELECQAVTARWKLARLSRDEQLMGTEIQGAEESWNQEGRLGYEQYAAYGLAKLGVAAPKAADPRANAVTVHVDGIPLSVDRRDMHDSVAHNYVTSEPYVLDGLETGFRALPEEYAARILQVQIRRSRATGILTAWSEDNIDRAPWFVYNSIYVDGKSWSSLSASGQDAAQFRGSSIKAALGWHVLFRTQTTARVYRGLRWIADPEQGAFAGYYELEQLPNRALTLNTNGVVLEAYLRGKIGQPIEAWAHSR
jgi:hypothetical protein